MAIVILIALLLGCFTFTFNVLKEKGEQATSSWWKRIREKVPENQPKTSSGSYLETELDAAVATMALEGYMDNLTGPTMQNLTLVDDPVLSEMLTRADREVDLRRALPSYRLRLKVVPDNAPEDFKRKYTHVVTSRTHGVGVRLTPNSEEKEI